MTPSNYNPHTDSTYMSEHMLNYFKQKLLDLRTELSTIESNTEATLAELTQEPGMADSGALEDSQLNNRKLQDKQMHELAAIEAALDRITQGSYGYCELSKEPIGVDRLDAYPQATYTIAEQERIESEK